MFTITPLVSRSGQKMFSRLFAEIIPVAILFFSICPGLVAEAEAWPLRGSDSLGVSYEIRQPPQRVVCLVPEITEILIAIGASDALVGVTIHTTAPEVSQLGRIGGFLAPEIDKIAALKPDLILAADLHQEVRDYFRDKNQVLTLNVFSIEDGIERLTLLGRIFEREDAVAEIIAKNRQLLAKVARKAAEIPDRKRQRVMRLMGFDALLVPGDNSYQNEYIRAAGAISPEFGKNGQAVTISSEEWRRFDPQVIYYCGSGEVPEILAAEGVKEVSAVLNNRVYSFSCDLTCRAGVNIGNFVALLANTIYPEEISGLISPEQSGPLSNCVLDEN